jgi:hypothetical protein
MPIADLSEPPSTAELRQLGIFDASQAAFNVGSVQRIFAVRDLIDPNSPDRHKPLHGLSLVRVRLIPSSFVHCFPPVAAPRQQAGRPRGAHSQMPGAPATDRRHASRTDHCRHPLLSIDRGSAEAAQKPVSFPSAVATIALGAHRPSLGPHLATSSHSYFWVFGN